MLTAGSEVKRNHVRALGAARVLNSRTSEFADALLAETGGRGVDVVLNTLSGEFVPASFRALAIGGRFIEVGKREVFTPEQARQHRPDAIYHLFDLGTVAETDEKLIQSLLSELIELIETSAVPPLPVEAFPYSNVKLALRTMAEATHIGKLVLLHVSNTLPDLHSRSGAYLITGGFGALGLEAARWLAGAGVETVVLLGPRRRHSEVIDAIEARGTRVIAIEGDCTDADCLRRTLSQLSAKQKLRGVVHCAGLLADALLPQQSWASFESVAQPKFAGALALHQATAGMDIDQFVLFSSAAAVIGSAGQANYAAANAMMRSIARARRARGEVALCVEWGPWTTGMAADDRVLQRNVGLKHISPQAGYAALDRLVGSAIGEAAVLPLNDWD